MVCFVLVFIVQHIQIVVKCLACTIGQPLGSTNLNAFCLTNAKFKAVMFEPIPLAIFEHSISKLNRLGLSQFFHFQLQLLQVDK
jgi:hypothetical protein